MPAAARPTEGRSVRRGAFTGSNGAPKWARTARSDLARRGAWGGRGEGGGSGRSGGDGGGAEWRWRAQGAVPRGERSGGRHAESAARRSNVRRRVYAPPPQR